MKVTIAGYNVDKSLLDEKDSKATPETISAAYARISRSKKSVTQLRHEALQQVEKARASNQKIVFDMGHSSIAEHAVFNFDIIGISRYLTEYVQKSRLASFTEKSQRYVTFDNKVVVPEELQTNDQLLNEYHVLVSSLYELYEELSYAIEESLQPDANQSMPNQPHSEHKANLKISEKAKEDARYVLPLATETQMGMTINARNLEVLLRRLAGMRLSEAKVLYNLLSDQAAKITPSLIKYVEADTYGSECLSDGEVSFYQPSFGLSNDNILPTRVYQCCNNGEDMILAALIFDKQPQDFNGLIKKVGKITASEKAKMFQRILAGINFYHKAPQSFEMVDCLIQMSVSACCFAQLKRHRIATLIRSSYHPRYGYVIPPTVQKLKNMEHFATAMDKVAALYQKMEDFYPGIGNYIITNAHRRNVLMKTNLRELYHFSRLRSDKHAQWEIRDVSLDIDKQLKKMFPNSCSGLKGKSQIVDGD